jgi:hypothetical protein
VYQAQILERVHALGAAAQLAWRLRPAQQQFAQDGRLWPRKIESLRQAMLVFRHAAVRGGRSRQPVLTQPAQRL